MLRAMTPDGITPRRVAAPHGADLACGSIPTAVGFPQDVNTDAQSGIVNDPNVWFEDPHDRTVAYVQSVPDLVT